ncbi:MAG: DUF6435 family protein [Alphaproteobacteria bacterium]
MKVLQKRYESIMQEALAAQRKGNIQAFADLHRQGASILREIEDLNACKTGE